MKIEEYGIFKKHLIILEEVIHRMGEKIYPQLWILIFR